MPRADRSCTQLVLVFVSLFSVLGVNATNGTPPAKVTSDGTDNTGGKADIAVAAQDDPAAAAMIAAGQVLAKGHTDGKRTFGQGFLLTDPTKPHNFMPANRGGADRPASASRFAFLLKEPLRKCIH